MTSYDKADIIIKVLTNSASEVEQAWFNRWVEDKENRKYFEQVKIIWQRLNATYDDYEFDEAAARDKIVTKLEQQHAKVRVLNARFWISAAASVLILLSVGIFTITQTNILSSDAIVYHADPVNVQDILLPDGSHVWLNSNSSLELLFDESSSQRKVKLKGEGYFEVRSNPEKPFKVYAGNTVTRVVGTAFNIWNDPSGKTELVVDEGKVQFYPKSSLRDRMVFTPGQKGIIRANNAEVVKEKNTNQNYLSWKTGILKFSDTPITEVCRALSKHYNKPVNLENIDSSLSITGSFKDEKLTEVLSTISLTLDISYTETENGIVLHP